MKIRTSAFLLTALASCGAAWATDPPPRYGATAPAKPKAKAIAIPAEQKAAPAEPAKTAEAPRKQPKRRAVYQQFDEIPMRHEPSAVYGPTLTPRIDPTPVPPPITINCVGAACVDAGGGSYKGGVGTSLISPQGRICNNNGITVQCF